MKRVLLVATVCLVLMLIFGPVAFGQETTAMGETTQLPPTGSPVGGPATLLPAAALLVGSGVLTYAIVRRRT